jgi:diphosphomevalonate decarboxylase
MTKELSIETLNEIRKGNSEIVEWLKNNGWVEEEWPLINLSEQVEGESFVSAHPILGIEKYLGMVDKEKRIAHFPSLKLTNDSFTTKTYCRFDSRLKEDIIIFGEQEASEKDAKRVKRTINVFRELTGIKTNCLIVSKHIPKVESKAKGLGLSASAGGAVAKALCEAVSKELSNNLRFLGVVARHLSGSATSSVAGGFSVWFSFKGIDSRDCYAVRVDKEEMDLRLVIVPIPKSIKTEDAHTSAEKSFFYEFWAKNKPKNVLKLLNAIKEKNVTEIGRIAELDSLNLFHLLVSGNEFFNWNAITLDVLMKVVELRKNGLTAFCSMDTGPSIAVITTKKDSIEVKKSLSEFLNEKGLMFPVFFAEIAGSPKALPLNEKKEIVNERVKELLELKGLSL